MGGSNSRPEKPYPPSERQLPPDLQSPSESNIPPKPPVSPSNQATQSRSFQKDQNGATYLSRYIEDIPEERLHKSHTRSVKLERSGHNDLVKTKVRVNDNVVTVKEEKVLVNSSTQGTQITGFQDPEFQNKRFKKFSINALIKEKDLVKDSNYFDQSHSGQADLRPIARPIQANFAVGELGEFQTMVVKTMLFDRNIT